jgi:uncharacterized protein YbjT (DUF2867 family)
MNTENKSPNILIAGASGYIGRALIPVLLERFPDASITALARSSQESDDARVTWQSCDLFSLKQIEDALPSRVDLAIYLVHSMGPTAQLDQGSFADYDLILADNFARAIKETGVKQLIYLGGLIPEVENLSLHLQSRLEVEDTFKQHAIPLTVFRAGLITGEKGSSFQILIKLVKRLPFMVCPRWTQSLTSPVDLPTVLTSIASASLVPEHINRIYDLAACKTLTYIDMMRGTARCMGRKRRFVTVPFFTPTLSRLWVSLITNAPKNLVYPLIQSLEHDMVAREDHLFPENTREKTYDDLLENASYESRPGRPTFRFRAQRKTVRSVQRLPLPAGKDAAWILNQYTAWLPRFLAPIIKVDIKESRVRFSMFTQKPVLLEMNRSDERSNDDRVLLYIDKGLLASKVDRGRLEFRVALDRRCVLAAIHEYRPALPWFLYKYTQAKVHLFVMNAFARHLNRMIENET